MKKISLFLLLAFACNVAFAQNNENKNSAFQFSFITPLSTNGLHSCEYTNSFSVNLLVGVSENEKYFTLAGLTNVILNDASGFQFAGISNHIDNEGRGFQLAGLANTNKNNFSGFQLAGLINIAKDVKGVQFAGLVNIAENSDCPIGLINIIKNGEKSIAVTYDGIGNAVVSFRSGGKYTYGILQRGSYRS